MRSFSRTLTVAVVLAACSSTNNNSECTGTCRQLQACNMLPSMLGSDQDGDAERSCINRCENSELRASKLITDCFADTCEQGGSCQEADWCNAETSVCVALHECIAAQVDLALVGNVVVKLGGSGTAEGGGGSSAMAGGGSATATGTGGSTRDCSEPAIEPLDCFCAYNTIRELWIGGSQYTPDCAALAGEGSRFSDVPIGSRTVRVKYRTASGACRELETEAFVEPGKDSAVSLVSQWEWTAQGGGTGKGGESCEGGEVMDADPACKAPP